MSPTDLQGGSPGQEYINFVSACGLRKQAAGFFMHFAH